jgi:hypothetical protein
MKSNLLPVGVGILIGLFIALLVFTGAMYTRQISFNSDSHLCWGEWNSDHTVYSVKPDYPNGDTPILQCPALEMLHQGNP